MDNLKEATLQSELRFKDLVINPCHRSVLMGAARLPAPAGTRRRSAPSGHDEAWPSRTAIRLFPSCPPEA